MAHDSGDPVKGEARNRMLQPGDSWQAALTIRSGLAGMDLQPTPD
jgi:hypothetical protein